MNHIANSIIKRDNIGIVIVIQSTAVNLKQFVIRHKIDTEIAQSITLGVDYLNDELRNFLIRWDRVKSAIGYRQKPVGSIA